MTSFPPVPGEFSLTSVAPRPQLATDVPGAVAYTNLSRGTLYEDMRTGALPAFKHGARTILFYDDLDRYMRARPRASFTPVDNDDTKREAIAEDAPDAESVEGANETPDVGACLAEAKRQLAQLQQLLLAMEAKTAPPK